MASEAHNENQAAPHSVEMPRPTVAPLVLALGIALLAAGVPFGLGFLVPAYFSPNSGLWNGLNEAALRVPLIAIVNPNNGPANAPSAGYKSVIDGLRTHGGEVVGYIYSSYTDRPLEMVKADIDRYDGFYTIDGFFVDEMTKSVLSDGKSLASTSSSMNSTRWER